MYYIVKSFDLVSCGMEKNEIDGCCCDGAASGVTTYKEFTSRVMNSHRRIKETVTPEVFAQQVTNRFGLMLNDEAVQAIASDLGWSDEWMITNKRKAKAPAPKSGDIVQLLAPPKAAGLAHSVAEATAHVMAPVGPNPVMVTPPPRPLLPRTPKSGSPVTGTIIKNKNNIFLQKMLHVVSNLMLGFKCLMCRWPLCLLLCPRPLYRPRCQL